MAVHTAGYEGRSTAGDLGDLPLRSRRPLGDLLLGERLKSPGVPGVGSREFKLPWREAGPPNHDDDKVDSDQ